ncbi:MAG: four helix bundle protein [Thermodesulfobacteriota bacterium]|nr:four helix bundle protein [Thermodesulfobacteriota bacterium]
MGVDSWLFIPFEDLRVFQLAEKLADEIWNIVIKWEYFEKDTIGKQLVRSTDSIGANIAEGAGRGTANDNRRFIRISRGSLYETRFWLRRASKRSLVSKQQAELIRGILNELGPSLNAYLTSIGKEKQPNTKY